MTPAERQRRRRARLRDEVTEETQPDDLPPMRAFCCKDSHEVDVLVRAPAEGLEGVFICGDCAGLAWQAAHLPPNSSFRTLSALARFRL